MPGAEHSKNDSRTVGRCRFAILVNTMCHVIAPARSDAKDQPQKTPDGRHANNEMRRVELRVSLFVTEGEPEATNRKPVGDIRERGKGCPRMNGVLMPPPSPQCLNVATSSFHRGGVSALMNCR